MLKLFSPSVQKLLLGVLFLLSNAGGRSVTSGAPSTIPRSAIMEQVGVCKRLQWGEMGENNLGEFWVCLFFHLYFRGFMGI